MRTSTVASPRRLRASALAAALSSGFVLVAAPAGAADAPPPKLLDTVRAEADFIDDPFAISPDGQKICWITTDGASRAQVHIAPIGKTSDKGAVKAWKYGSITPERVEFLDNDRVLVTDRNPQTGMSRGEVFGPAGPAREKLGPATDIALGIVGGTPAIVTYTKTGSKTFTHTLAAFRRDNLKPLGRKVFAENADGRVPVPGGSGKVLYFVGGYVEMVAQHEGDFDKAKDIRKPDVELRFDVFSGKILVERDIPDVVAFATLAQVRRKFQNDRAFVRFTEDYKQLLLYDGDNAVTPLETPRPLRKYDAQTLAYQRGGDGALFMSLTVDPVHAEAVKAQKADKDWLDIYHLDVKSHAFTELARVDGQKRPTAWRLGGGRLGVLRKHKGFGRGGEDLEVFDVASPLAGTPAAPVASPAVPAKGAGAEKAPAAAPDAAGAKSDAPKSDGPAKLAEGDGGTAKKATAKSKAASSKPASKK